MDHHPDLISMDLDDLREYVYRCERDGWQAEEQKGEALLEVYNRMKELVSIAGDIVRGDERAESYWLAHLKCNLDHNHTYMDRSTTMIDTVNEYTGEEYEEDYA